MTSLKAYGFLSYVLSHNKKIELSVGLDQHIPSSLIRNDTETELEQFLMEF